MIQTWESIGGQRIICLYMETAKDDRGHGTVEDSEINANLAHEGVCAKVLDDIK